MIYPNFEQSSFGSYTLKMQLPDYDMGFMGCRGFMDCSPGVPDQLTASRNYMKIIYREKWLHFQNAEWKCKDPELIL